MHDTGKIVSSMCLKDLRILHAERLFVDMTEILQAVLIVKQQTQINIKHLMCVNKKYGYIHFA
jgi:hypothetical protein